MARNVAAYVDRNRQAGDMGRRRLDAHAERRGFPSEALRPDAQGVDALADIAGTIGYEVLTSLGPRYARRYNRGAA